MVRVILLRILSKNSPFLPDRKHIHHLLIDSGISHKNSVLTLYSLNIVFVGLAVFIAITAVDTNYRNTLYDIRAKVVEEQAPEENFRSKKSY